MFVVFDLTEGELLDIDPTIASTNRRSQRDKKHFAQVVAMATMNPQTGSIYEAFGSNRCWGRSSLGTSVREAREYPGEWTVMDSLRSNLG
ncbi:hypothetical protein Poly51_50600 [Rubripirellula tenax]|uniref:Uncharacterized protein n=1 Tax=Rubripirellula tenax TaxID=2528015 RepID=A0A5C6EHV0_9BACT|nr:hypothetical protein Poly51_50600 [Rubripirellula tenax]